MIVLDEEWKENFRMSKQNFFNLAGLLRPFVERQVTVMRDPISVETQLAVMLLMRKSSQCIWSFKSLLFYNYQKSDLSHHNTLGT